MKFNAVQSWLDNVAYAHSKNKNTPYYYRYRLGLFCDFIKRTPEQILEEFKGMTDREFRREYAHYLKAYISNLTREGYAPTTIQANVTAVKSFFKYSDLPLGYIPTARNRVVFHNRDITKGEIVQILKASRPRDAAYYCIMGQSGLRPVTLSQLKRKHIEPDFTEGVIPCEIDVPEELAKGQFGAYFTFMGEESVKYLESYFNTRRGVDTDDYLFTCHGSEKSISRKSMSNIFIRTLEDLKAAGTMDFEQPEEGRPRTVRMYNLRKWFRKQAGHAGVEYVNFWMGHHADYKAPHIPQSDEHYFSRKDVEFHRQLYVEKAMPHLRLETKTPTETEQEIIDLRKQLEARDKELRAIHSELARFRRDHELLNEIAGELRDPEKMRRFKLLMQE